MFFKKLFLFFYYVFRDVYLYIKNGGRRFSEFGLTLYCGKQGAGKTTAMVEYLERMRKRYPNCKIFTNFGYVNQTDVIKSWDDLINWQPDDNGVIFAFDEIHAEFSAEDWQNFPPDLLRQVSQQRKQCIKIVGTAQRFNRVVKQLREQTYTVVECFTFMGRWTFTKAFDADEYNVVLENPDRKNKLHRLWRRNFIQTDDFRNLFDTYLKIQSLKNRRFVPMVNRTQ